MPRIDDCVDCREAAATAWRTWRFPAGEVINVATGLGISLNELGQQLGSTGSGKPTRHDKHCPGLFAAVPDGIPRWCVLSIFPARHMAD
jgi:hypothetical protein